MPRKWYQNWFNSPYYHILYHQRNDREAEVFIDSLFSRLRPDADARVLDVACGRGRHSVYVNRKGYDVTGIDLSHSNIEFAKQFENERLHFFEHDMRHLLYINYFDITLNLFTSFGYFESERDHLNALKSFRKSLKPGGLLVLDYFNRDKILSDLTGEEIKVCGGIVFHIRKAVEGDKIIKTISFDDGGSSYLFQEEVQAFSEAGFRKLFAMAGLRVEAVFGDYLLKEFDPVHSDRLIMICKKADV
jgi:SAM-dependent methyltransferase